jgi:hypothetical protein
MQQSETEQQPRGIPSKCLGSPTITCLPVLVECIAPAAESPLGGLTGQADRLLMHLHTFPADANTRSYVRRLGENAEDVFLLLLLLLMSNGECCELAIPENLRIQANV